jgi:hypothetical protein
MVFKCVVGVNTSVLHAMRATMLQVLAPSSAWHVPAIRGRIRRVQPRSMTVMSVSQVFVVMEHVQLKPLIFPVDAHVLSGLIESIILRLAAQHSFAQVFGHHV